MADLYDLRERFRRFVQDKMATDPAHDLAHLDRVWRNARTISQVESRGSARILLAASYLHDLVNLPKDHPDRKQASTRSAEAAQPILTDMGFAADEIQAIKHAITAHSFSAGITPETD